MNLTELKSLKGEQLRIAVAEREGWKYIRVAVGDIDGILEPLRGWQRIPRYSESRDAITEAILRRFADEEWQERFIEALVKIIAPEAPLPSCLTLVGLFCIATASAEDLCRAFLAALKGEK